MTEIQALVLSLVPLLLYAEIHSKLPPFPNVLNNRLPEIIADAPLCVRRNSAIPLLILAKDAHLFPVELISVKVRLFQGGVIKWEREILAKSLPLSRRFWSRLYEIEPEAEGPVEVEVVFSVLRQNKLFTFRNHSYPSGRKTRLRVSLSSDDLPDSRRVAYGDVHYHSQYTDDAVEFGAPIEATAKMAKAMGLSFFAVTDHSYDLDDDPKDPAQSDPRLRKWNRFLAECASLDGGEVAVLPGIELSAGNGKGQNVHLLILNPDRFHSGRGDSGKMGLKNRPDESVADILKDLGPGELAIAAHPFQKLSLPERLLLRRGIWGVGDIREKNLAGLQIFNGRENRNLKRSLEIWADILSRGEKKFIFAGNDAHGNFNRQIRMGIPFVRLKIEDTQRFGYMKTGVLAEDRRDKKGVLSGLSGGRCFVTTGPSIVHHLYAKGERYGPGDEAPGRDFRLSLEIMSIKEFGKITSVSIILGDPAAGTETRRISRMSVPEFTFDGPLPFGELPGRCYVRIACESERGMAVSNPVWIAKREGPAPD